ncbi:MAG: sugar phosphate isomerase/epimerase family protein [bacterium]
MQLGIGTYTFPWAIGVPGYPTPERPLNAMGLLRKAQALGVSLIQICDNLPLHEMKGGELDELRTTARDMGIRIEVGTRGVKPDHLLGYLDIAKSLRANILRTVIDSPDCKPDMEQAAVWIEQVLPKFVEAGVHIAIENHDRHRSRDLAKLIRRINSQYVGICLDTVNSFGALEGPEQVVRELAPYVLNLHIKDFNIVRVDHRMGFTIFGCPAGDGRLDIEWLLDTLKKEGRNPNAILELWTPFSETVEETILKENEWANKSIRFLSGYFKRG